MFRFCLLICLSVLLYGSSASPYKSWGKEHDTALQETRSDEFNEKMTFGLKEVEPLEDLDLTDADIDPGMLIWKAVKQFRQQKYDKPEEDKDMLYHPSELRAGKLDRDVQLQSYGKARLYEEPEQDMDELYHSEPEKLVGELKDKAEEAEPSEKLMYMSPEEDKDDLYHGHIPSGSVLEAPVVQAFDNKLKIVYKEPEKDLDKLYHS
ncbi:uncharacterized protein si:ch211-217g15.3 [Colossoma macropomum]|uniref:uncharacterized protein si:ch211-217g15.3 n=1 Tax=Colossoma macropomum TaxID=42526 RepID=UPI0018650CAA|nr:uncharacterized protein si:ch211-217g15.3 [Colossoma macropomum]